VLTSSSFLRVQELEGTGYSSGIGAAEGTASRQPVDGLGGGFSHFLNFFLRLGPDPCWSHAFNEGWTRTSGVCLS
jgi:hypothetical protein